MLSSDDAPKNAQPTLEQVILSRRQFLGLAAATGAAAWLATAPGRALASSSLSPSSLTFTEIAKRLAAEPQVAPGYAITPLLSWGDPLFDQGTPFAPLKQTPEDQARRFGYNNDFIAYVPLENGSSTHGLLCVNHEYTILRLMFPNLEKVNERFQATEAQGRIEQEAHGVSVVEVTHTAKGWKAQESSRYNRRITATTPIEIRGPAAGSPRMQTAADPKGRRVLGTLANCAGGVTPWGTVLTCEENFDEYFANLPDGHPDDAMRRRYTIGNDSLYNWHLFDERFDVTKEPNECHRFGWVVEYDPRDPASTPVKRTALGRFKHECATCTLTPDGRVAVYSGDDEVFEYVYRFVTAGRYDADNRAANRHLLDEGTLSVARFEPDGVLRWLPLVFGQGPLTKENGFDSQADVVIYARRAADLVGATPMDRPEDVEVTSNGLVYVSLTKNHDRKKAQRVPANRRAPNPFGHILEMQPPLENSRPDHAADAYRWEIFLEGGDPAEETHHAYYPSRPSAEGWLTNPDNLASDPKGNLWICTDGQQDAIRTGEGIYAVPTQGEQRGRPKLFFTAPIGAEVTGPCFTPDGTTLFVSVQHPGEQPWDSTYDAPSTRWPVTEDATLPPRPTVIAITKEDGTIIGS